MLVLKIPKPDGRKDGKMGRQLRAEQKKQIKANTVVRHYRLSKVSERKESAYDWFKRPVTDYSK